MTAIRSPFSFKLFGMQTPPTEKIDLTRSQILRGNSLKILASLPNGSIDAIVTDPPYASLADSLAGDRRKSETMYSSSRRRYPALAGAGISPVFFGKWLLEWIEECFRVLKPGGMFFCFMDWRGLPALCEEAAIAGLRQDGLFVWHKTTCRPQQGKHRNACEFVFAGRKPGDEVAPRREVCGKGFFQSTPVRIADRNHLTEKPLALMTELMSIIPAGAVVLDPFAGSGSTVVACEQTGRIGIGVEIEPEYAAIAERRLKEAQEKGAQALS